MEEELSRFQKFGDYQNVSKDPGIYIVCAQNPFLRLSGERTKILYIGKAGGKRGLRGRVRSFFTKSGSGRKAILRFRKTEKRFGKKLLYLCRSYKSKDAIAVRKEEKRLLKKYERIYWELPPLNHSE